MIELKLADKLLADICLAEYALLNAKEELSNPEKDIVVKVTADYFLSQAIAKLSEIRAELN
jgi:hypothetical protein